jgi:hypothetical protein
MKCVWSRRAENDDLTWRTEVNSILRREGDSLLMS